METNNEAEDSIPEVVDLPTVEDGKEDKTDWKAQAQQAHDALKKAQGIAKRFQTKLSKLAEPKPAATEPAKPAATQSKGFDYGQLAYLETKGITDAADQTYLEGLSKESGTELKDLLAKSWVQAELKERKELRATAAATPTGTKRAGNTTKDQVDYWIAKGELPPVDQRELRQKVVNAKMASQKSKGTFYNG